MKLELKHLVGYLPYGLKVQSDNGNITDISIELDDCDFCIKEVLAGIAKPILRPLSDLTNDYCVKFYDFNDVLLELINIDEWTKELIEELQFGEYKFTLYQFNLLHEWHFDIYGLIEKGLAIDINEKRN